MPLNPDALCLPDRQNCPAQYSHKHLLLPYFNFPVLLENRNMRIDSWPNIFKKGRKIFPEENCVIFLG